jgi:hypothetical protein
VVFSRLMYLCPACADNLKEVRSVIPGFVSVKKRSCEECGKMRYCSEYAVGKKSRTEPSK